MDGPKVDVQKPQERELKQKRLVNGGGGVHLVSVSVHKQCREQGESEAN